MDRDLDAILADAAARLSSGKDGEFRVMVDSRTACKLNLPADVDLEDLDLRADLLTLPPVAEALRGRPVKKWLVSKTYINIIPDTAPTS